MVLNRANPSNWSFFAKLTRGQINYIDGYSTYILDRHSIENGSIDGVDTLASDITVDTDGYLYFASKETYPKVEFGFKASTFTTYDGYLSLKGEIRGDVRNHDPLRFGYQAVTVLSNPETLLPTQYDRFVIKLIGQPVTNPLILFPDAISTGNSCRYAKLIDNQVIDEEVYLRTVNGSRQIKLLPGEKSVIYCNGTELDRIADYNLHNVIIEEKNLKLLGGFNQILYQTPNNTFLQINKAVAFNNVQAGDIFDIKMHGTVAFNGVAIKGTMIVSVGEENDQGNTDFNTFPTTDDIVNNPADTQYNITDTGISYTYFPTTQKIAVPTTNENRSDINLSSRHMFTCPATPGNNTYKFYLNYACLTNASAFSALFKAPIILNITQFRPVATL